MAVGKVRFEPGEGGASDTEGGLKAGEEDGVIEGVESCTNVQEDEDAEGVVIG